MTADRAIEIMNSREKITVLSDGVPVWIESVDKVNGTAQITIMGSDQKGDVLLSGLTDTGAIM